MKPDLDSLAFAHLGGLQQRLEEWEGLKGLDQSHSPKKVEYVKVMIYPNTIIHFNSLRVHNNNNNNCRHIHTCYVAQHSLPSIGRPFLSLLETNSWKENPNVAVSLVLVSRKWSAYDGSSGIIITMIHTNIQSIFHLCMLGPSYPVLGLGCRKVVLSGSLW